MVLKACPVCNQQVPVACKSCFCGHIFFTSRRARSPSPPVIADQNGIVPRRRAERPKKIRTDFYGPSAFENRLEKQLSTNSSRVRERSASFGGESSPKKRKPGRPKSAAGKSKETSSQDEKEKKEEDVYATLSEDKAFIYSVILDEINWKLQKQWKGPAKDKSPPDEISK